MSENKRRIQAYPTRSFTAEGEVWNEFKGNKEDYGGNWTKFLMYVNQLIKKDNDTS